MPKHKYTKQVFPNGLTLLTVPIENSPSVTMSVFFKVGSRYESKKINGISHFLEHLHFKGSKNYPSAKKLSEAVDSIGGEFNANTGKEHTQYYIRAASNHLPLVFNVLTDMMQNPLFNELEIEREKGVIIEEINMYKDTPQIHVESLFEQKLWPNTSLGRDIAGTAEVIRTITRKDIINYKKNFYQPANTIIAVGGKFNQAELLSLLKKFWLNLPKKSFGSFEPVKVLQTAPRLSIENRKTEQAHMIVGFPGFSIKDKQNPILKVLSVILGGGMSSRLFLRIRERNGLAYYIHTSVSQYLDTGVFAIQTGLKIDSAPKALEMILEELEKIKKLGVTKQELNKAKEYIKGKTALSMEDSHEQLDWHLGQEAFLPKIKSVEQFNKEIDLVTLEQVQRVAKKIIQKNRLNVALIGPFQNKEIFEKLLF